MYVITIKHNEDLTTKQAELSAKVAAYKAAQAHQLQHGGPGPVAEHEIMVIVNEHAGQFVIELEEQEVVQEELIE